MLGLISALVLFKYLHGIFQKKTNVQAANEYAYNFDLAIIINLVAASTL